MSKINDGGPAFPVVETDEHRQPYAVHQGMSLRDWFAGQSLVEMIRFWRLDTSTEEIDPEFDIGKDASLIARDAYKMADAMITAREAQP